MLAVRQLHHREVALAVPVEPVGLVRDLQADRLELLADDLIELDVGDGGEAVGRFGHPDGINLLERGGVGAAVKRQTVHTTSVVRAMTSVNFDVGNIAC